MGRHCRGSLSGRRHLGWRWNSLHGPYFQLLSAAHQSDPLFAHELEWLSWVDHHKNVVLLGFVHTIRPSLVVRHQNAGILAEVFRKHRDCLGEEQQSQNLEQVFVPARHLALPQLMLIRSVFVYVSLRHQDNLQNESAVDLSPASPSLLSE